MAGTGTRPTDTGGPGPARWTHWPGGVLGAAPDLSTDSGRGQDTEVSPRDLVSMDKADRQPWDYSGGKKVEKRPPEGPVRSQRGDSSHGSLCSEGPGYRPPDTPFKVVLHKPQGDFSELEVVCCDRH